jgi:hypothetical protein
MGKKKEVQEDGSGEEVEIEKTSKKAAKGKAKETKEKRCVESHPFLFHLFSPSRTLFSCVCTLDAHFRSLETKQEAQRVQHLHQGEARRAEDLPPRAGPQGALQGRHPGLVGEEGLCVEANNRSRATRQPGFSVLSLVPRETVLPLVSSLSARAFYLRPLSFVL